MAAIVGMAVFMQYWYWFPLTHFLALSFTPTSIIGVDSNLEIPSFTFHSNTRPSMFDYPPEVEVKTEEAPEKVKTAVLSTTAQAKRRKLAKDRQNRTESMDVDPTPSTPKAEGEGDKMDTDDNVIDTGKLDEDKTTEKESSRKKAEKEKVGYELENMSRVLPAQTKYISFPANGRYQPVKKVSAVCASHPKISRTNLASQPTGGVILLEDTRPDEAKSLLELKARKKTAAAGPAPGAGGAGQPSTDFTMADLTRGSGATAAAGVLNAVDEDDDGEEAPVPDEFEVDEDEAEADES
jgi:26S proteasome regulatory subunit N2